MVKMLQWELKLDEYNLGVYHTLQEQGISGEVGASQIIELLERHYDLPFSHQEECAIFQAILNSKVIERAVFHISNPCNEHKTTLTMQVVTV